jgi:hypothetical protein
MMADGGKPKGPLGAAKPAQGLRGPAGLAKGDEVAQGPPALDAPKGAVQSKTFSYFGGKVRVLVALMPYPTPSRESLTAIRATTGKPTQIGYTNASVTSSDEKETPVGNDKWYTAVLKLTASKMAVPKELWVEERSITAEKDPKALKKLQRFRKAYDDILEHERKHLTVAFDWLKKEVLGFDAAWGGSESKLPDKKAFSAALASAVTTANSADGPLKKSADDWDDKDLSELRSKQREVYITIGEGSNPTIYYHPPRDEE